MGLRTSFECRGSHALFVPHPPLANLQEGKMR